MIAVLDAGSQYIRLIGRILEECKVSYNIFPIDVLANSIVHYKGIIITGGPDSINEYIRFDRNIINLHIPMLGICYGMQLISYLGGAKIETKNGNYGQFNINVKNSKLFSGMDTNQQVLLTHKDCVVGAPQNFKTTAMHDDVIMALEKDHMYGVQFHPEVDMTTNGKRVFENFLYDICNIRACSMKEDLISQCAGHIRLKPDQKVIVLVSGGVDSSVCLALLTKIFGPNRVCGYYIDNGFMRLYDTEHLRKELASRYNISIIDASEKFRNVLCKITDPEEKRRIIGDTFIEIAKEEIFNRGKYVLAQGTLRPDLIESASKLASGNADLIKTHHNDSPLVRELRKQNLVLEPLQDFHKDDVRKLGKELGLADCIINRKPFPGPGLAIRILCHQGGLHYSQPRHVNEAMYSIELPIKSVGVKGDQRSYGDVCALYYKYDASPDYSKLFDVAVDIPRYNKNVNRVVYFFQEFESDVLEITPTYLNEKEIKILQQADQIVENCREISNNVSQIATILLPVGVKKGYSIVIRTIITNDFMTGRAAFPGKDFPEESLICIVKELMNIPEISSVGYDLTAKPPGTIEWE